MQGGALCTVTSQYEHGENSLLTCLLRLFTGGFPQDCNAHATNKKLLHLLQLGGARSMHSHSDKQGGKHTSTGMTAANDCPVSSPSPSPSFAANASPTQSSPSQLPKPQTHGDFGLGRQGGSGCLPRYCASRALSKGNCVSELCKHV